MKTNLFDIIDRWTLEWDRALIEIAVNDVAKSFNERGLVFFMLEDLWDLLETVDDPTEYMTEERKIMMVEQLLRDKGFERAAKAVEIEVSEGLEYRILVLNADELISQNPSWFKKYEADRIASLERSPFD